jgi:hypothetical protein
MDHEAVKTCIFVGPSTPAIPPPSGVDVLPPARLGAVHQAVLAGYNRVAIVDAYFGNVPSVWHKEILFALASGVEVWGAGSTGALRAAELAGCGMRGVGIGYRLFRRNILTDDDELCLLHTDRSSGYRVLTVPMINARFSLRRMRRQGFISAQAEQELAILLKKVHFSQRSVGAVRHALQKYAQDFPDDLGQIFTKCYVDVKKHDTAALFKILGRRREAGLAQPLPWTFPQTSYWRRQFVGRLNDFPPLGSDCASMEENLW